MIESEKDWWAVLEENKEDLVKIVHQFNPPEMEEQLHSAILQKNSSEALRVLHIAWFNAPDEPGIHRIPGWGILCDLLSEGWVFNPDEKEE